MTLVLSVNVLGVNYDSAFFLPVVAVTVASEGQPVEARHHQGVIPDEDLCVRVTELAKDEVRELLCESLEPIESVGVMTFGVVPFDAVADVDPNIRLA
jgi:hypothetical protein